MPAALGNHVATAARVRRRIPRAIFFLAFKRPAVRQIKIEFLQERLPCAESPHFIDIGKCIKVFIVVIIESSFERHPVFSVLLGGKAQLFSKPKLGAVCFLRGVLKTLQSLLNLLWYCRRSRISNTPYAVFRKNAESEKWEVSPPQSFLIFRHRKGVDFKLVL